MELRKTATCEALCLQRGSLGRRGEAGSSLKLLHQTREDHTTNLLWKLATERSPGHHGQEREKRTRVLLEQTGSSLDRAQHTPPRATCPSVPLPYTALQEQSLAQSLFHNREGSGMYPHKPRTCKGKAGDMLFSSRKATSPHIFLSHNRAEKPLSSVTVLRAKLQGQRQGRLRQHLRDARTKYSLTANLYSVPSPWAPAPSHRAPAVWQTSSSSQQLFTVHITELSLRPKLW